MNQCILQRLCLDPRLEFEQPDCIVRTSCDAVDPAVAAVSTSPAPHPHSTTSTAAAALLDGSASASASESGSAPGDRRDDEYIPTIDVFALLMMAMMVLVAAWALGTALLSAK
jgi:hypothetical protein